MTPPPTADIFASVAGVEARVRALASALFAFYRSCPGIDKARRDQDKIAVLDEQMRQLDGVVSALVRAALGARGSAHWRLRARCSISICTNSLSDEGFRQSAPRRRRRI